MPELRIDPISGRRVYVAEDRAGRPTDFAGWELAGASPSPIDAAVSAEACPFCAGNEAATPHESAKVVDEHGRWQIRVVPNKYPAVTHETETDGAFGAHEVIIESPDHVLDVVQLGVERLYEVLRVFRDRLQHWATDSRLKHGLVFKNSGFAAGASLQHVHSQLMALPYVPEAVQSELKGAADYCRDTQRCIFCDLIEREVAAGSRLVLQRDGLVAFCAVAGRQPYETWILPEEHAARFDAAEAGQLRHLATVLHDVLRRLEHASPGAAYNLVLHSGPFDGDGSDSFHWHWELIPRLTHLAGLEWGAGVFINPLSPERAAQRLREVGA